MSYQEAADAAADSGADEEERERRGIWLKQREELAVNLVNWAKDPPVEKKN